MLNSKKDYEELLLKIINPLKPFYTPKKAGIKLAGGACHYEAKTLSIEAYLRPLWGLVPFFAGGGQDPEFASIYRKGIAAGTDPENPEYWGLCRAADQRFVEMAALAYGILLAPAWFWDPLSQEEKENTAQWLNEINRSMVPGSNWRFFQILVNVALKKKGMSYDPERLEDSLRLIDSFYISDGWYFDGHPAQRDYYVSFAIHFYSLIYAKFMEDEDPVRCARFKERSKEFCKSFIYWVDENGAFLPYGRSMTYRFAQAAFFSACVLAGVDALPLGVFKGIISRHLEYWMSLPIFDNGNILTVGYGYPNLYMAEDYNGFGSPYWALKTFAVLALPEDHPFWQADCSPLPQLISLHPIPAANMLISRTCGHVTAYTPGKYMAHPANVYPAKYGKFAYSTLFTFSVPRSSSIMEEAAPDSMLAFQMEDRVYTRKDVTDYRIEKDKVYSLWKIGDKITVETELIPTPDGHIRRHKVTSQVEAVAYDCGFAVSFMDEHHPQVEAAPQSAQVTNDFSYCKISCVEGEGETGTGEILIAVPNTNLLYPKSRIPMIRFSVKKGTQVFVTRVEAGRRENPALF